MSDPGLQKIIPENDQTQARRDHLEALRALVGNVYPNKFERSNVTQSVAGEDTITAIVDAYRGYVPQGAEGEKPSEEALEIAHAQIGKKRVRIAGRMISPPRVMGKAAFFHLSDGKSRLQIYLRRTEIKGVNNSFTALADESPPGVDPYPNVPDRYVDGWSLFTLLDQGDFIGIEGQLFVTKAGELSVRAETIQFLAKALRPMPSKIQGISSAETRQRQRYADLIAGSLRVKSKPLDVQGDDVEPTGEEGPTSREVFELRSKVVREIRRFLDEHGYIEVETPMLTALATGAAARPFKTHHNALDIDLFARIAPELYLKRLVVGGFEKVYELNRNFRNEGIDRQHNPEFTMLEFYWAYADVNQMMDFAEKLLRSVVYTALGHTHVRYGEHNIDFSQSFQRMTMKEAIAKYWPSEYKTLGGQEFRQEWLDDPQRVIELAHFIDLDTPQNAFSPLRLTFIMAGRLAPEGEKLRDSETSRSKELSDLWRGIQHSWENRPGANSIREPNDLNLKMLEDARKGMEEENHSVDMSETEITARNLVEIFESIAEPRLLNPTFITDFPKPVSPLSKASPSDPTVAERFEYFVGGLESANGFSELNDPEEQYQRFKDQGVQRERGDEEAMVMDEDYIRALSYGMPPAAGIGVGIDRLVMLLANKHSIRDVILFPHLRPEQPGQ